MKEKEEDEERNDNICLQADNQVNKQRIQTLRSTLILCGSSGERANNVEKNSRYLYALEINVMCIMLQYVLITGVSVITH